MPRKPISVNDTYPRLYLSGADLHGRTVTVKIDKVTPIHLRAVREGQEPQNKILLHFDGKQLGLLLNSTSARAISRDYGDDASRWRGKWLDLAVELKKNGQPRLVGKDRCLVILATPASAPPAKSKPKAETLMDARAEPEDHDPDTGEVHGDPDPLDMAPGYDPDAPE